MALVCVETEAAGRMPADGMMVDSGRGALAMPSVEARGFAGVELAHATEASGKRYLVNVGLRKIDHINEFSQRNYQLVLRHRKVC